MQGKKTSALFSMDQRPCVSCDGGDDEGLMLLCDECNQPWHATCVGFKGLVLGDWLCGNCSALEHKEACVSGSRSPKRERPK